MLGLLLIGLVALASADDEKAKATEDLGTGYVMAFPMEDSKSEDSADSGTSNSTPVSAEQSTPTDTQAEASPTPSDGSEEKEVEAVIVETPSGPDRPKADDIRKILGVYNAALSAKLKPIPPEKPKQFLFPPPRKQQNYGSSAGIAFVSAIDDQDEGVRFIEVPGPASSFMHRSLVVEEDNDLQDTNDKKDKESEKDDDDYDNDNDQIIVAVPSPSESQEPKRSAGEVPAPPRPPMGMPLYRPPMFNGLKMPFRPPVSPMVLMLVAKVPVPVPVPVPSHGMRMPFPVFPHQGMMPPPFPERRMGVPQFPMMSAPHPAIFVRPFPGPMSVPQFFGPPFPHPAMMPVPPMYGPPPMADMMPYPASGMLPPPAYMMPPPMHPMMPPPPMHPMMPAQPMPSMMRHPAIVPPPMHPMMPHPAMMSPYRVPPFPMPGMVPPSAMHPPPMSRGPVGMIVPVPVGIVLPHPGIMRPHPPKFEMPAPSYRSRGPPPSPFLFNGPPAPRPMPFPVQRPAEQRMMPQRRPFMIPVAIEERPPVERFPPPPPPPPPSMRMEQRGGMIPVLMRSYDGPRPGPAPVRIPAPVESSNQQQPVLLRRPPPPPPSPSRAVEAIMGPVHRPVPMAELIRRQARLVVNAPPEERLGVSYMGPKATPRIGGGDMSPAGTLETASTILRFLLRNQGA